MERIRFRPHSDIAVELAPGESEVTIRSEGFADEVLIPPARAARVIIPWHKFWFRTQGRRTPVYANGRLLEEAE